MSAIYEHMPVAWWPHYEKLIGFIDHYIVISIINMFCATTTLLNVLTPPSSNEYAFENSLCRV